VDLTAAQPPLFRLQKVERRFGSRVALQAIDLTVRPRELILLAGPSGSGKSTLLRLLAGVLGPSSGLSRSKVSTSCP
jgi:ABC-type sugar transport system ATPase subunit